VIRRTWFIFAVVVAASLVGGAALVPAASAATPRIWVANGASLVEFEANATGNATPIAVISGSATGLGNATSVAVDSAGNVWAVDLMGGAKVWEFHVGSHGNVAPIGELAGANTHITEAYGIWFDPAGHLFLGNVGTAPDPDRLLEFAPGARGNVAPVANIAGGNTGIDAPGDVVTDAAGNSWSADFDGSQLQKFAAGATGNVAPIATIKGSNTGLDMSTPFGIALDAAGHVFASNQNSSPVSITEYSAGAKGNVAPIAKIAGSNTKMGLQTQIKIDAAGRIIVANGVSTAPILEFAAGANGNVAPTNVVGGSNTGLGGVRSLALVSPSVVTGLAGGTGTSAKLVGTVNPQASDTHYHFDWGTTTAYGQTTASVDAGSGSTNASVSATIGQLNPGAKYHFRLTASNDGGLRFGADHSFTVPATAAPGIWIANQGASTVTEHAPGAFGNVSPLLRIAGSNTQINGPFGIALDGAGDVFVANNSGNSVGEFAPGATGNVAPIARIFGAATGLGGPNGIAVGTSGKIYVVNSNSVITEYAHGANGNAAPVATLSGANTRLSAPQGLAVDGTGHLFVANSGDSSILEFAANANGNVAPIAALSGANTGLLSPEAVALNTAGYLNVGNGGGSLKEFAPGASGNVAPIISISGAATGINTPFGVAIDAARRLFSANFGSSTVTEYVPGVTGNVAPAVTIRGPLTGLKFPGALVLATPFAVTKPAASVAATSATLKGTVNPQGIGTHYMFQYGTSTTYGHSTVSTDAGVGRTAIAASASVSGLTAATTYHYRTVAVNDAGTKYGLDMTFKTP
jgi:hypothetical protein